MTTLAALAAATLFAGCGSGTHDTPDGPDPSQTAIKNTQDGAVPISVVTSFYVEAAAGHGAVACSFTDPAFQKTLVQRAVQQGATKANANCASALTALNKKGLGPVKVTEYEVKSATNTKTVLVAKHAVTPDEQVTLTSAGKNKPWTITEMKVASPKSS